MKRRRFRLGRFLLLLALVLGIGVLFREGWIPGRYSPLPPIDLAEAPSWLLDWRLAEIRRDPQLCRRTLKKPQIVAASVPDRSYKIGCGWKNAVRITEVGGARLSATMTCEMATALALWMVHDVQPLAQELLKSRVVAVRSLGTYACRNIVGPLSFMKSEHASANALDVAGFVLADGRTLSLTRHWSAKGPESQFLRVLHTRACRYFRVTLGPEANKYHRDHFHFDRGILSTCR